MNRIEVINHFIEKNDYKSYLEIGCQNNATFDHIKAEIKTGVDPIKGGTHNITSDEFFQINQNKFDIVFIDGLHHADQVERDIVNALACLNKGGTIVVHDLLPWQEDVQIVPRITKAWVGDVWKAWVKLRQEKANLKMYCIDTDFVGLGIIQRGKQTKLAPIKKLDYKGFAKNKKVWMNIISLEEFKEL